MTQGWKEWAYKWVGIQNSCVRGCIYCFATEMALRYKRITTPEARQIFQARKNILNPDKKYPGRIAFPNTHDITESNYQKCRNYLDHLLKAGNDVLIVTKPDFSVIKQLIGDLLNYSEQVEFRITIGSRHSDVLKKFEPGASDFRERLECLSLLWQYSFHTSVSIEPYLSKDVAELIDDLWMWVERDIWVGKMNHLSRIAKYAPVVRELAPIYSDEVVKQIYYSIKKKFKKPVYGNLLERIKFKDSFRRALNNG
ncbi:MAG: hypothetical protein ACTSYG_07265 [Candidatus Heimdallarchaeota archaeon]